MRIIIFAVTLILTMSSICLGQSIADPCETLIPSELSKVIKTKYPKYRIARTTDYSEKIIEEQKGNNPNHSCLAIASADVDGDGSLDYAFFLTNQTGRVLLLAARNLNGRSWHITKLSDFPKGEIGVSYVNAIEPGSYEDIYADDPDIKAEPGNILKFSSTKPGFLAGTIESSGIAYFFSGKRWIHLWLSD